MAEKISAKLPLETEIGKTPIKITVTIDIDYGKVTNAIVGALEGGYSPWLHAFNPVDPRVGKTADDEGTIWYARESFWVGGGSAVTIHDDPDGEEGEGGASLNIGHVQLVKGLTAMAEKAPSHFADLVNENDDAITHDVFMQMVIFGEIIYG